MLNGLSLEFMSAEKAPGIWRGSLLIQVCLIRWNLTAERNRGHKISVALHPFSALPRVSATSKLASVHLEIKWNGRFVRVVPIGSCRSECRSIPNQLLAANAALSAPLWRANLIVRARPALGPSGRWLEGLAGGNELPD